MPDQEDLFIMGLGLGSSGHHYGVPGVPDLPAAPPVSSRHAWSPQPGCYHSRMVCQYYTFPYHGQLLQITADVSSSM